MGANGQRLSHCSVLDRRDVEQRCFKESESRTGALPMCAMTAAGNPLRSLIFSFDVPIDSEIVSPGSILRPGTEPWESWLMPDTEEIKRQLDQFRTDFQISSALEIRKVIVVARRRSSTARSQACTIAGGHVLLEGVPRARQDPRSSALWPTPCT